MDLSVVDFIIERLAESNSDLETRKGTAYYDLFIKPQELMLQPFVSAMDNILIGQSIRRILNLPDPNTFDQQSVDDLVANVFVTRYEGSFARTSVRVFYAVPLSKEYPAFSAEFSANGTLEFFNEFDFSITSAQMALQVSGNQFYMDLAVRAQTQGDIYNVDIGAISVFVNDSDAVSVTNAAPAVAGTPLEDNVVLLNRAKNSIGVRDLETIKGINAIINQNFPYISEIQAIGMGDPEMQRDIIYNAHVGGNTDIYLKMPALQQLSVDIIGLVFDDTRQLARNFHRELLATDFSDPASNLGTPFIVTGTVSVTSDTIETAAAVLTVSIPSPGGINLDPSTAGGHGQYIKLQLDQGIPTNIKLAGANPSQTQQYEIVDSINAAVGINIATPYGVDQVQIQSTTIGANSILQFFLPDSPRTDATTFVIPTAVAAGYAPPAPAVYNGIAATVYVENVDYQVDYEPGKIIRLPGSAILSGQTVSGPLTNGSVTAGTNLFKCVTANAFALVQPGDSLFITAIPGSTGLVPGTYTVSAVNSNNILQILNFNPTGSSAAVSFYIVSNQVIVINLEYNPLSVDIGSQVILANGISRGIRPGRDDYTIKVMPYLDLISVEEIDPNTLEGLGNFLKTPGGYGSGGYGTGGYGVGTPGQVLFFVNSPPERFSIFEDSLLVFDPVFFGGSFRITYYSSPELNPIHKFCRDDTERVTGADVLPKIFVPAFVDTTIQITRDPTNILTPSDDELVQMVSELINTTLSNTPLQASSIVKLLENTGLSAVTLPFTLKAKVVKTDGSTTILSSEDYIIYPPVVLPSQTSDYVTSRITHWYPRNIVITETT